MQLFNNFFKTKDPLHTKVLGILATLLFILGISSVFVRQPTSWYDEEIHYVRSIQIANGDILRTIKGNPTKYGGNISVHQNEFVDQAFRNKLFDKKIQSIDLNWEDNYNRLSYTEKMVYRISVTAVNYMPFQYFPFVSVAYLNHYLKFNVATEFIAMKIAGFLVSFTLILLAVRKLPFGKMTLLLITLAPPYFLSISSITADSFVFGIIPLFLAYTFAIFYQVINGERISNKELAIYSCVALALTLAKPPACLLVSLILFIIFFGYRSKSVSIKQIIYLLFLILSLAFITLLWLYIVRDVDGRAYFGVVADTGKQISFIQHQPFRAFRIFFKEISNYNFLSMQLGYADQPYYMLLPILPSFFYLVAIFTSIFIGEESLQESCKKIPVFLFNSYKIILFLIILLITFAILYLQFNPVASDTIGGVQPRYFLPYWMLVVSIFPTKITLSKSYVIGTVLAGCVPILYYIIFMFYQL
ncbi:DUF2142 domain-containing protein [Streptococcus hongkongensis]|nr:hypothetical protein NC01_04400 [Streptococcus uberis]